MIGIKKKFGPGGTFKDRIAYAKKMAEKVGAGSSRFRKSGELGEFIKTIL
jgi:hypothetical protein